jgi:hypothetical protein
MVNGIGAYQQQVALQQPVKLPARGGDESGTAVRRDERTASRSDEVSFSVRDGDEVDRRRDQVADSSTAGSAAAAGGKDTAQRRGSLLDVLA